MNRPSFRLHVGVLVAIGSAILIAAGPVPRWSELNHEANAAAKANDYKRLRDLLIQLRPLMPGNPRIAYNLAACEARLGNREAALSGLRAWAQMGLVYNLSGDEDFASLASSKPFAAILRQVQHNQKPVSNAQLVATLQETDSLPEAIAYDSQSRRFFISSVRGRKIITLDGALFAKAEWPILALAVDEKRRILWATSGWLPHCRDCVAGDEGKSELLAFDLDSRALKTRIPSPLAGLLGDMTISRNGEIYVSEGIHGAVLCLPVGATQLERLDEPGEFPSPQTPALSADEKTLFVPDYMRGIAAIDLQTWSITWKQPADGIALSGIDGLYVHGGSFIAIQNGTTPPRVVRFALDLRRQEVLEANTPGLGEPTHGTFDGGDFYFIADSGWNDYDDSGKKKAGRGPTHSTIRKIVLK